MPRQSARWGRRYPFLVLLACLLALVPLLVGALGRAPAVAAASNLPYGFYEEKVTTVTPYQTTAFAFVPDGRILLTEKPGYIRVYKNGALLDTPMLNITDRVNQSTDRGLLGITIDPNFANSSPYVYLAYTYDPVANPYQRNNDARKTAHVSRFTVNGDSADPASEVILLGKVTPPSGSCNDAPVAATVSPRMGCRIRWTRSSSPLMARCSSASARAAIIRRSTTMPCARRTSTAWLGRCYGSILTAPGDRATVLERRS